MAAAWLAHLAAGRVVVLSGGSAPASAINPVVVAAMTEVGIDLSRAVPKPWTEDGVREADVVVTMGCADACPYVPGKRYEDWAVTDPSGQDLPAVRLIRDDIEQRVRALMARLSLEP
jgi:arsenate reductase (thioredoxin)